MVDDTELHGTEEPNPSRHRSIQRPEEGRKNAGRNKAMRASGAARLERPREEERRPGIRLHVTEPRKRVEDPAVVRGLDANAVVPDEELRDLAPVDPPDLDHGAVGAFSTWP
jgi:hypothetical protein